MSEVLRPPRHCGRFQLVAYLVPLGPRSCAWLVPPLNGICMIRASWVQALVPTGQGSSPSLLFLLGRKRAQRKVGWAVYLITAIIGLPRRTPVRTGGSGRPQPLIRQRPLRRAVQQLHAQPVLVRPNVKERNAPNRVVSTSIRHHRHDNPAFGQGPPYRQCGDVSSWSSHARRSADCGCISMDDNCPKSGRHHDRRRRRHHGRPGLRLPRSNTPNPGRIPIVRPSIARVLYGAYH